MLKLSTLSGDSLELSIGQFPDLTQSLKLEPVAQAVTIYWLYQSDQEMVSLYYMVNHLREHHKDVKITLDMPYLPNARMDRTNHADEVFTLKYFAKFINALVFDSVHVLDVHSSVGLALIDHVVKQPVLPYITAAIELAKPDMLFMPDEGAYKRYASLCNQIPSTFGIKHRDWRTGEIQGYELAEPNLVSGSRVLIIDDISSYGGTFYHAANALLAAGAASVALYVTHCEASIFKGDLAKADSPITQIFTANPLFSSELNAAHENLVTLVN